MSSIETNSCSDNTVSLFDSSDSSSKESRSQSCWQSMESAVSSSKKNDENVSFLDFDNPDLYASQVCSTGDNRSASGNRPESGPSGPAGGNGVRDTVAEPIQHRDAAEPKAKEKPTTTDAGSHEPNSSEVECVPRVEKELSILHPIDSAIEIYHRIFDEDCPDIQAESKTDSVTDKADSDKPADIKTLLTSPGSEYRGEGLKEGIEIYPYSVGKNEETGKLETLEDVARNMLLEPTDESVAKYVSELRQINNLPPNAELAEGQRLMLAGHKPDGTLVYGNLDDSKAPVRTVSADGQMRSEYKNGTGAIEFEPLPEGGFKVKGEGTKPADCFEIERKPDGEGGYIETHKGSKPEDNYQIKRTADGKYLVFENGKFLDKTTFDQANPDHRVERARLLDNADAKIVNPQERSKLNEDILNFERRARKESISPEERANFYHQVNRLLEPGTKTPGLPTASERLRVAEQLVHHAADPSTIDQGNHVTCSSAALESTLMKTDPSVVARTVSDVAMSGQFVTTQGETVKLHGSVLRPDSEAKIHPPVDGKRSFASQLFQGAAITSEVPSFRQVKPELEHDTGDRELVGPTNRAVEFNGLTPVEVLSMNNKVAGDASDLKIVQNADLNSEVDHKYVNSEKELHNQLADLKRNGKLPAILFVDTRNEPFWTDSRAGLAGGSGSLHYVTVTDFNEKTGKVSIDNQWGASTDHKELSVRTLYMATEPTGTEKHYDLLKHTVAQNRKEGKTDYPLELQLLREQHSRHEVDDEKLAKELTKIRMDVAKKESNIKHRTPVQDDEFTRIHWASYMMGKQLPEAIREREDEKVSAYSQKLYESRT